MPFYEYKCKSCEHRFEELQSMDDEPIKACPKCKKEEVEKLIALTFKGNVTYNNPKEHYENVIKPDAKRIADKIKSGDEGAAADILGEDKMFG